MLLLRNYNYSDCERKVAAGPPPNTHTQREKRKPKQAINKQERKKEKKRKKERKERKKRKKVVVPGLYNIHRVHFLQRNFAAARERKYISRLCIR